MFGLRFRIKKGQSTLEYAIVIAVIVAALVVMQLYIRRGVQGRLRQSSDDIGEQFAPNVSYSWTTEYNSEIGENIQNDAKIGTSYTRDKQTRSGTETIDMTKDNWWPTGK